ncbi:hypothetical protein GH714_030125 [Hevea brasiliensis]|uniref:MSP domain-containing protein n=1 Tax=Hevea brasiliensis TaxID=3981 RepID=A0A6A6LEY7_HEVBR|nr:hypothetical protein GH714_030125 [Hevea brasiliensis]
MSTGELLSIEPLELKFPFELKKQISCSLQLSNKTDNYVAFKVKTTNPKKYCVRPNAGIVLPRSTCDVIVTMQAQKEAPAEMQCKDKFLLQSVRTHDGATAKDINAEMVISFDDSILHVNFEEGSEEGSSPRGSVSDNGIANGAEFLMLQEHLLSGLNLKTNRQRSECGGKSGGKPIGEYCIPTNKVHSITENMASLIALRKATASALFSKLLNPVRSASVAPSVSRSFSTETQVTNFGGDDSGNVDVNRRSSDRSVSRRRDTSRSFFPDVVDSFSPTDSEPGVEPNGPVNGVPVGVGAGGALVRGEGGLEGGRGSSVSKDGHQG